MLPLNRWMVAWKPGVPDAVAVGPWPDETGWSDRLPFTGGCCYSERHHMPAAMQVAMLFIDFHALIVRDGINPQAAHREFLKIDEYRRRISPDIPGASGG